MTGTDLCVNEPHKSRSYLNHLVLIILYIHLHIPKYITAINNCNIVPYSYFLQVRLLIIIYIQLQTLNTLYTYIYIKSISKPVSFREQFTVCKEKKVVA